jgi:acyl CoA:acetate/3-ketoacid CoA transferase beta subunit
VFQRSDTSAFKLIEVAPGVSVDDVKAKTTAHFDL